MAGTYQKDSKTASFKKHKGSGLKCQNLHVFFIVAELNNVILAFTDVKIVTERLKYLLFLRCLRNPWVLKQ